MCVYCLYKLYVQSTHVYSFLKRNKTCILGSGRSWFRLHSRFTSSMVLGKLLLFIVYRIWETVPATGLSELDGVMPSKYFCLLALWWFSQFSFTHDFNFLLFFTFEKYLYYYI